MVKVEGTGSKLATVNSGYIQLLKSYYGFVKLPAMATPETLVSIGSLELINFGPVNTYMGDRSRVDVVAVD